MPEYNPYQQMHHKTMYGGTENKKSDPNKVWQLSYNGQDIPGARGNYALCVHIRKGLIATGNYKHKNLFKIK